MFGDFFDTDIIEEVRRNTKAKTEFSASSTTNQSKPSGSPSNSKSGAFF